MTARFAAVLAAFVCAACATAGDVALLTSVPLGSNIAPPEKAFPAVPKFPVKVAHTSWTSVSNLSALGVSAEDVGSHERIAQELLNRARQYFETEGDLPTARISMTPARPQFSSGAEVPTFGPSTSASKSVQRWNYSFTVEDWENPARAALTLSGTLEVVATIKITFEEMRTKLPEWTRATYKRGLQNSLVELVETLDRNRGDLAGLGARYVAWRGKTPPAEVASRRDRIRRVEELLVEAERLNPGGPELAVLRRRLDAIKRGP